MRLVHFNSMDGDGEKGCVTMGWAPATRLWRPIMGFMILSLWFLCCVFVVMQRPHLRIQAHYSSPHLVLLCIVFPMELLAIPQHCPLWGWGFSMFASLSIWFLFLSKTSIPPNRHHCQPIIHIAWHPPSWRSSCLCSAPNHWTMRNSDRGGIVVSFWEHA